MSDHEDEVVPTSDTEEMEQEQLYERLRSSPRAVSMERECPPNSEIIEETPPRKRRRLRYDGSSSPGRRITPKSTPTPTRSPRKTPSFSQSSSVVDDEKEESDGMAIVGAQPRNEDFDEFDEAGSQDPLDLLGQDLPSQAPTSPAPTAFPGLFSSPSRHDDPPTATSSEREDSLQNPDPSNKRAITESPRPRTPPSQHRDSSPLPLVAPAQPVPPSPPPPTLQQIVNASGWSLRPRTAQQIQPYKHDMALYRRQVSRHQAAYVASSVGIDHRRTHQDSQYAEDDSQEQEELSRERRRRRLKSKSKTRSRSRSVHDDNLPSLSSSDSDSNDAGKEARAAARREKRRLVAAERERKEVEAAKKRAAREEAAERRHKIPTPSELRTPSDPGPSRRRSPDPPAPDSQQSSQATPYRRRNIVFSSPIGSDDDELPHRSTPIRGRFSTSQPPDINVNADGHISPPGSPPNDAFLDHDLADDADPAQPPPLTSQVPSENESEPEDPEPEPEQAITVDEDAAERERLKILGKMYPAFMLPSLRAKEAQKRRQKEREEKRKQRAKERRRSKSPAFVVPDAPVDDYGPPPAVFDVADGLFDFDFDVQAEGRDKGKRRAADGPFIEISDSEDEDEGGPETINIISDLEGSSDEEEPVRAVRIGREPDLIDYMLVRNTGGIGSGGRGSSRRNHGGKKEIRGLGFPRSGGSGRHIVTGRDRHQSKQMRLTAHGGVAWTHARKRARPSREIEVDSDDGDSDTGVGAKHQTIPPLKGSVAAQARKEKIKRRKEIQARNGVYTVQSSTPRYLLHANAFYTRGADLELEDTVPLPIKPLFSFNPPSIASRRAKAASAHKAKPRGLPARSTLSRTKSKSLAHHAHLDGHDTGDRSRSLPVTLPDDTNADAESSGGVVENNDEDRSISFSESTFIGKGYLFELVKCRDETAEPSPHAQASAGDVTFSTTMSVNDFLDCLSRFMLPLHEELFGHADINAPMEDAAVRMGRVAAVTVSHLLRMADNTQKDLLKEGVKEVVRELLAKDMDGLETKRGREPLGCMLWLPIELCFRVGLEVPTNCEKEDGNELGQACGRLVHWLLGQWSTSKTQKTIRHPFHPIELWICLFHVLRPQDDSATDHPLWHLVRRYLDVVGPGDMTHIEMSDYIWSLVFQLSDLSLFNVHGRPPIHRTRTPTAWRIVEAALGCISLEASPPYPASYDWTLARVVRFCFRLYNKYGWTLVSAQEVLNQLSKIFRARHYARFDHEDHHFPAFIRDCDWASIGVVRKDDSAYVVYLKLLYLACSVLPGRVVTKLLSQSVPVMPVRFENAANQRGGSPSQSDMSILTHRYVSAAMAVKMQPSQAAVRVKQACQYTNFKDANHAMRMPIIMGFNAMCQVLLHCSLPLDAKLFDWLKDMVEAVLKDYVPTKEGTDPKQNPTLMDVWMLMRGVMYVLEAYAKINAAKKSFRDCLYPDPELLNRLQKIVTHSALSNESVIQRDLAALVHAHVHARAYTLPPRARQPLFIDPDEDSQELLFDDDDDMYYGLLDGNDVPSPTFDLNEMDRKTVATLRPVFWRLKSLCVAPLEEPASTKTMSSWIEGLVGVSAILASSSGQSWATSWAHFRNILHTGEEPLGEGMARFKVTRLAFYLLRISPELYQGVKPGSSLSSTVPGEIRWAILRAVVETLASETVAVEHAELLAEFLALEQGRCLLFKKVVFKRLEDGEFEVPSAVLEEKRVDLMEGVLTAVDGIILVKGEANPEVVQYVGLCKRLFSRMRGIVNLFDNAKNAASRDKYKELCRSVVRCLSGLENLSQREEMIYWKTWVP